MVALGKETNIINLNYLVPPSDFKYKGHPAWACGREVSEQLLFWLSTLQLIHLVYEGTKYHAYGLESLGLHPGMERWQTEVG